MWIIARADFFSKLDSTALETGSLWSLIVKIWRSKECLFLVHRATAVPVSPRRLSALGFVPDVVPGSIKNERNDSVG